MENNKLQTVAKLYTDNLEKFGIESRAVGWGDEKSHVLRFDKLLSVINQPCDVFSVNDLGCGYGAFYMHLKNLGFSVEPFYGYDISEAMIKEANRLIGGPDVKLIESNILDNMADYSFACGIFNVRMNCNEDDWCEFIIKTLDNLHEQSEKGFAFNLLSSYVEWKDPNLYYGDPKWFFDYCKKRYSRYVSLLHDYPLWEWTIAVKK